MWGTCDNGTEALGCGNPETYRNCADVTIGTNTGILAPVGNFFGSPLFWKLKQGLRPNPIRYLYTFTWPRNIIT